MYVEEHKLDVFHFGGHILHQESCVVPLLGLNVVLVHRCYRKMQVDSRRCFE